MKWLVLFLVPVLIFAGVGGYILYARGILSLNALSAGISDAEKQAPVEKAGLTVSILKRDQELKETAARLEELAARLETEREALEAERALVEERIKALKEQEEQLKALRQNPKPGPVAVVSPKSKLKLEPWRPPAPTEEMIKLAKMYESMPAEDAAPVLENLPDSATAQILLQMRRRQASQIMGLLSANKAASVSKLLFGNGSS